MKGLSGDEIKRIFKFGITGVGNTLVDMALGSLLLWLGVNVYLAKGVGYCAGMLNSYLINRKWTFHTKDRFFSLQLVRFIITNLAMLAASMLFIRLFTTYAGLSAWWAMLVSTGCTLVLNFLVSRLWVFR